jgi:hypothetical protein
LFAVFSIALVATTGALWTSGRALEDCMDLTSAEREAAAIGGAAREQYGNTARRITGSGTRSARASVPPLPERRR